MKRKSKKVNSEAGTLKQTKHLLRNGMKIPAKLAALFLMFSLALTNMSFVQDSDSIVKSEIKTTASTNDVNDTCCDVKQSKVTVNAKKILKLYDLPSAEMIRNSDSEANNNLAYSLTENKVKALRSMIAKSDAEITERFKAETSVHTAGMVNTSMADEVISNRFRAENLSLNLKGIAMKGDKAIQSAFEKDLYGIRGIYASATGADEEMHKQFLAESARISIPSADTFQMADAAIQSLYQIDVQSLVINKD